MWVSFQSFLSCAFCEQEGTWPFPVPLPVYKDLETACETRRTRASFTRGPGGVEDDCLQYYCTSTVMVWLAATRAWSFVAPVTVIWCVPLLMPLKVP
jgi:hypothetical protein